jgi:hypothetical protein
LCLRTSSAFAVTVDPIVVSQPYRRGRPRNDLDTARTPEN